MSHKVFVYGSLKKGFGNHSLIQQSKFIGAAETLPVFTMVSMGSFPACMVDGETIIKGEIYEVSDDTLQTLDWLEGHPRFYKRIKVATNLGESWMYILNDPANSRSSEVIKSGVWSY